MMALPSGTSATVAMLKMAGFDVDLIDAGCCGMAGTFGYDTEHYELSMQVGELGVLREMRNAEARMQKAVSTGSACRLQIKQGTGVEAQHPLILVRDTLLGKYSRI
jgi:Fe-S oxidoreductase